MGTKKMKRFFVLALTAFPLVGMMPMMAAGWQMFLTASFIRTSPRPARSWRNRSIV
jgi:hypothetical protein